MNFTVDTSNNPHMGPDGVVDSSSPVPASNPFDDLMEGILLDRQAESGPNMGSDLNANPPQLHNARDPFYRIQRERFEHRVIIFLKAEGYSNLEIAEKTGMSAVAISNIIRQPWAQRQILDIIHSKGGDAVSQLLNGAAADAVQRLIIEKDNMDARSSERTAAADKILDRIFGKPNQPLQYSSIDPKKMSDEELEAILRRGAASRGGTTTT
jgi:hypothetical protein